MAKLREENAALRKSEREHEKLEKFIAWLNDLCTREKMQICGIRKITYGSDNQLSCYIGFVMHNRLELTSQFTYKYSIMGYLSTDMNQSHAAYNADVYQRVSNLVETNTMHIEDNQVLCEDIKRKGVGSAGLTILKDLAKRLHCTQIDGTKVAKPDTPAERAKLTAFYAKNGFSQTEGEDRISYHII